MDTPYDTSRANCECFVNVCTQMNMLEQGRLKIHRRAAVMEIFHGMSSAGWIEYSYFEHLWAYISSC